MSKVIVIITNPELDERVVIVQFQRIKLSKLLREVEGMEISSLVPSVALYASSTAGHVHDRHVLWF